MDRAGVIAAVSAVGLTIGSRALRRSWRAVALGARARRVGATAIRTRQRRRDTIIRSLALSQFGYSRRIVDSLTVNGLTVYSYAFETGFDRERRTHRWCVVSREAAHGMPRAVITAQPRLLPAVCDAALIEVDVDAATQARWGGLRLLTSDDQPWTARLDGAIGAWIATQPAARTWEVLPGRIVAYESLRASLDEHAALREAVRDCPLA
jgi:hypothetical protein